MDSTTRFFQMIENHPRIAGLWDRDKKSLDIDAFERSLGVMSSGEVAMAQFFASIWFNNNQRFGFDLVDAVSRVELNERKLIVKWIADPFYP